MKINEILVKETASAGATSSSSIAAVVSPHIAIGPDRFKTSYTGTPGQSGKRAPRVPKAAQKYNANGTAKGAHELTGTGLFGGPLVKR
jgi:hypothetical protein